MNENSFESLPHELEGVADEVRSTRPTPTPAELDRVRSRVRPAAKTAASRPAAALTRSRLAITSLLVTGLLLSGTSAALGVSGISSRGSAGAAQYPTQTQTTPTSSTQPTNTQETQPTFTEETIPEETTETNGEVIGTPSEGDVQATRQVEGDGGDRLPFSGLAAIPLLLLGAGMTATGVVLRRRAVDG